MQLSAHFSKLGIICRPSKRRAPVTFNRSSPVYLYLITLLKAIARVLGQKATPKVVTSSAEVERNDLSTLFGTRDRTLVLAMIEKSQRLSLVDLARSGGLHHGSVRAVVSHLASEGVVKCERVPPHVFVELDERYQTARELRELIHTAGREIEVPIIAGFARQEKNNAPSRTPCRAQPVQFVPIGTRTQAQILLALARVGSIRVADLAKLTDMTQDAVRGVSESLVRSGLVVRESRSGGRNRERWLSLNTLHPFFPTFVALLRGIGHDWPLGANAKKALTRSRAAYLQGQRKSPRALGSDRAFQVLNHVHTTPGRTVAEIAAIIDLPIWRVRRHVYALESVGILRFKKTLEGPRVSVNQRGRYSVLLVRFLDAVSTRTSTTAGP